MTRLVLVHGIGQAGLDERRLVETWMGHLRSGAGGSVDWSSVDVSMPFYGDVLGGRSGAVAQGGIETLGDGLAEGEFLEAALGEMAREAGVSEEDVDAAERELAGEPVPMGAPMGRRPVAIARAIERVSPSLDGLALRLVREANAYLRVPAVMGRVDGVVRSALSTGPAVVVGHSLGSVVAFRLLREMARERRSCDVPLFVTAGSPLSLRAVRNAIGPDFARPPGVERWINLFNREDIVSLGRGLVPPFDGDGVEDVEASGDFGRDPHSAAGYLSDPVAARAIAEACGAE